MEKMKMLSVGNKLEIERALTKQERNRILDAADQLLLVGRRSRDRYRNGGATPPQRKNFRLYRNRAIICTLIETGMRRSVITSLNLVDIDFDRRILSAVEKNGSREERQCPAIPISKQGRCGDGRLPPMVINTVWNQVRDFAGVDKDKTPHSARYGMGGDYGENRQCGGGATAAGAQERLVFSADLALSEISTLEIISYTDCQNIVRLHSRRKKLEKNEY